MTQSVRGPEAARRKVCSQSRAARGSSNTEACRTLSDFRDTLASQAGAAERVAEYEAAHHSMVIGVDERGFHRFLPSFLQPMVPSRDLMFTDVGDGSDQTDNDGVTEQQRLICLDSGKPNSQRQAALLVRAFMFERVDPSQWRSPSLLLEMRKGDAKAHALLLCSVFLGLNTDAYVCIGTCMLSEIVDGEEVVVEKPHVWVMTRESTGTLVGPPYNVGDEGRSGGSIAFWESTTGEVMPLLPNRWEGADDSKAFNLALSGRRRGGGRRGDDEDSESSEGLVPRPDGDDSEDEAKLEPLLSEEQMLCAPGAEERVTRADRAVSSHEVFLDGSGVGGAWGKRPQDEIRGEEATRKRALAEKGAAAEAARRKAAADALTAERNDTYRTRDAWIQKDNARYGMPKNLYVLSGGRGLPYKSLHAVFNHQNLWINIQPTTAPTELCFDLQHKTEGGWLPVIRDYTVLPELPTRPVYATDRVSAFYPPRSLGPRISEDRINAFTHELHIELEEGITNYRSTLNLGTRWGGEGLDGLLQQVLQRRNAFERLGRCGKNGWDPEEHAWSDGLGTTRWNAYQAVISKLTKSTPPAYKFRLGFCTLAETDPRGVRKAVMSHTWNKGEDTNLPELSFDGREMFALAVMLDAMDNSVARVLVGLMCVYPDMEAMEKARKRRIELKAAEQAAARALLAEELAREEAEAAALAAEEAGGPANSSDEEDGADEVKGDT